MIPLYGLQPRFARGGAFDFQKTWKKTGIELHPRGYQYLGPGTHLKERLARGDPGINQLDRIAKQHDIAYSKAQSLRDKHKADRMMVKRLAALKDKTNMERGIQGIMQAKLKMGMGL